MTVSGNRYAPLTSGQEVTVSPCKNHPPRNILNQAYDTFLQKKSNYENHPLEFLYHCNAFSSNSPERIDGALYDPNTCLIYAKDKRVLVTNLKKHQQKKSRKKIQKKIRRNLNLGLHIWYPRGNQNRKRHKSIIMILIKTDYMILNAFGHVRSSIVHCI